MFKANIPPLTKCLRRDILDTELIKPISVSDFKLVIWQIPCFSNSFECHLSFYHIHTLGKTCIRLAGSLPAHIGYAQRIGQRCIGKSECRGIRHSTWYVGYSIMHYTIHCICRFGMSCRMSRLKTAALIHSRSESVV